MSIDTLLLPEGYQSPLNVIETEIAIKSIKDTFERQLAQNLHLTRVSAPLFVDAASGLNDDLNGVERPVQFDIKGTAGEVQIVQSLAKWKRLALKRYGLKCNTGLYTDMNAIRRDEDLDNLHSAYVDQWDWEMVVEEDDRNINTLRVAVRRIVSALKDSESRMVKMFPKITPFLESRVTFITSEDLLAMYPGMTPKQREDAICQEHKTVFIIGIGHKLSNGEKHDGRAPDYDDWNLNGDLLIWYPVLNRAVEISSMGIRVSPQSLDEQLTISGCDSRRTLPFHSQLLNGELPYTMGGGIGQSRICMLLLQKAHIGEVQASIWPDDMAETCANSGINLL